MLASETEPLTRLFGVFSFVLGCCIGSFLNVVVWRLPRGESLTHPGSHCPKCGHAIRAWENIPVISWLLLRARCSKCHLPISVKYPIGEALTGLLFAFVWMRVCQRNLPLEVVPGFFYLTASVLAAALIDAEHKIIPNEITYSGMVVALLLAVFMPGSRLALSLPENPHSGSAIISGFSLLLGRAGFALGQSPTLYSLADCLLGAAMGFAVPYIFSYCFKLLKVEDVIGGGDIKFLAMSGAFLGADAALYILMLSSLLACLCWLPMAVFRRKKSWAVPFGPFLGIVTFVWMVLGNPLYLLYTLFIPGIN